MLIMRTCPSCFRHIWGEDGIKPVKCNECKEKENIPPPPEPPPMRKIKEGVKIINE
jgi:hypothetical protein